MCVCVCVLLWCTRMYVQCSYAYIHQFYSLQGTNTPIFAFSAKSTFFIPRLSDLDKMEGLFDSLRQTYAVHEGKGTVHHPISLLCI